MGSCVRRSLRRSVRQSPVSPPIVPAPRSSARRDWRARGRSRGMVSWSACLADPSSVSIVIPALNEEDAIGDVVSSLRSEATWREILVVDDGSRDATGERAALAGALVVRHPYTKGNGAAVKTGIRRAEGQFILILDADGQHAPADARRLVERLGDYDLVVGARSAQTQATVGRRIGNQLLNGLASYLTGRRVPDLTSGFRGARREHLQEFLHLLPNGFSTPTTTTLAFIKAGYNVTFEPVRTRAIEDQVRERRHQVLSNPP